MTGPIIRVLLADDHRLVRAGLSGLLNNAADISVVGEAADGQEAVRLSGELVPDVILMDLSMPILDGIEATRRIVLAQPSVRIIALTSFLEKVKVSQMLTHGAVGYLLKDCEPRDLLAAVRSASAGGAPLDPRAAVTLLPGRDAAATDGSDGRAMSVGLSSPAKPDEATAQLSGREREVLILASRGLANKQIGRSLGIAERTVKVHLTNVFRRIGVGDRTSAALWARDHLAEFKD